MLDGVVQRAGGVPADHLQPGDRLLRLGRRLEALHQQGAARRQLGLVLAVSLALVVQGQDHQQLAGVLGQVLVQGVEDLGRQAVVARCR